MKYLVLALFLFPFTSFGAIESYANRTPSGSGSYQTVVYTVNLDSDLQQICDDRNEGAYTYWTLGDPQNGVYAPEQYPLSVDSGIFTLTYSGVLPVIQVNTGCDSNLGTLFNIEYDGGNTIFTLDDTAPPPNIWGGSDNGFWGDDFSTVDIKDSLQASVQATGVSIWPLLYLVGVPLAFAIAYYLLDFLYYSIYRGQTSKISSQSPYLDKMVYRPYKGYNRLRSRAWNRKNTMG